MIIAALVFVGHLALQYRDRAVQQEAASRRASVQAERAAAEYHAGDRSPDLSPVNYASSDRTLLLFVRSTCGYCTASMPFYVRLREAARRGGQRVRLVAVSADTPAVLDGYLEAHGLEVDLDVPVSEERMDGFRIRGTPTLVLADKRGVIRQTWVGAIPAEREDAVIAAITGETATQ